MAIVKISEPPGKRAGDINGAWESTYSRRFQVVFDSPKYGAIAAAQAIATHYGIGIGTQYKLGNAPDEPSPGDPGDPWHEADPAAKVRAIRAQQDDKDGRGWEITVEYGPGEASDDPLNAPPDIQWQSANYERPVDKDTSGNAIINAAGDPFDPAPTRDDSRPVLVVVQNEASFSASDTYSYRDSTNNATFFGAPAGTCKLKSRTAVRVASKAVAGGFYWKVTYTFEFNEAGWKKILLNAGYREKVSGNLRPIYIGNQPATSPVLLDASGVQTSTPHWLEFAVYQAKNFGDFGIAGS